MARSTSIPPRPLASGLLLILSLAISVPEPCQAAARLIRVPLQRSTTQSVGSLGQPVVNYYSVLHVGSPPVAFKVQFDVGLSESFLPHYSWNPFNRNLHYSEGFQCKSSSTCTKTDISLNFAFQGTQMTGKRYEDSMALAMARLNGTLLEQASLAAGASMHNSSTSSPVRPGSTWRQNFIAVSSASDGHLSALPIDGFVGLSPMPQSPNGINNLLISLHTANLIDNIQFSIWFNPVLDSPNGGEIILGGVDTDRYQGQIYWHHLPGLALTQWSLSLQQVSLGHIVVSSGRMHKALLDSGSSDIRGPREEVTKIYNMLNTTKSSSGLELIDCRRIRDLPYITFLVDGIPYYLLPSNYIRKTVDGRIFKTETCYVAILPSNDPDPLVWTLATPFLGAYYTIFDITYRQVGFAALK